MIFFQPKACAWEGGEFGLFFLLRMKRITEKIEKQCKDQKKDISLPAEHLNY